jgi:hypothetical protein
MGLSMLQSLMELMDSSKGCVGVCRAWCGPQPDLGRSLLIRENSAALAGTAGEVARPGRQKRRI